MLEDKLNNMKKVMTIIYIDTEVKKIFIDQGVSYARNMLNTKYGTYQSLV